MNTTMINAPKVMYAENGKTIGQMNHKKTKEAVYLRTIVNRPPFIMILRLMLIVLRLKIIMLWSQGKGLIALSVLYKAIGRCVVVVRNIMLIFMKISNVAIHNHQVHIAIHQQMMTLQRLHYQN